MMAPARGPSARLPRSTISPASSFGFRWPTETWIAETEARAAHGGLIDRTIGALFLSAYLANSEVFFVGKGARIRFNLSPDQLRRGLDRLEDRGLIETAQEKRKGRYRRIRLR